MARLSVLFSIVGCLLFPFKLMAQSPEITLSTGVLEVFSSNHSTEFGVDYRFSPLYGI